MADIIIPIQTGWDMLYSLITDQHFLAAYFVGLFVVAFLFRRLRLGMIRNIGAAVRSRSSLRGNSKGVAPILLAIIPILAYIGVDIGIGYLFSDKAVYVYGMTASEFLSETWLILVFLISWALFCMWYAFPSGKAISRLRM